MRSSTASVTWTPQNGIPMHPIFNSVGDDLESITRRWSAGPATLFFAGKQLNTDGD